MRVDALRVDARLQLVGRRCLEGDVGTYSGLLQMSSDGRRVAWANDRDRGLEVWDRATNKTQEYPALARLGLHPKAAAFSPDGKTLAESSSNSDILRLWDMETGKYRVLKWHARDTAFLVFSPDGKLLATVDHPDVICWDVPRFRRTV